MNRYWTRIALGALLVFGLGLTGMVAIRKGKAEVRSLLTVAAARIPLQLANLKFRFDGRGLGDITGIEVNRNGPDDLGRVRVRVALSDRNDLETLRACAVTLDDVSRISDRTGFRCAGTTELEAGELTQLGEISFEPGSVTRPLYLPRHAVDRWRHSTIHSLEASLAKNARGGVEARGIFDVRGHAGSPQRGSFSLKADPNGAVISVRDDRGRALVDFTAGANGVNLNLRDRDGRNLIKLLADSLGAALRVRN